MLNVPKLAWVAGLGSQKYKIDIRKSNFFVEIC